MQNHAPCRLFILHFAFCILNSSFAATAGESLVTVRFGEQDTCAVTGVTKLRWDAKAGLSHIAFDLAKLPRDARVKQALLRFWVVRSGGGEDLTKSWGFARWSDPKFDGFKVWKGQAASEERLAAVRFPFNTPAHWCFEFDVTKAVQDWAADPAGNDGLCTNFQFPVAPDGKPEAGWQRPYLQITHVGPNPGRPKPPAELRAFQRPGQVFLTWKQAAHEGAFFDSTCRVYRHTEELTARNLAQAELLGEVHRLSQLNYRRILTARGGDYGPWRHYLSAAGVELEKKGESNKDRRARALGFIPERFNFVIDDSWPRGLEGGEFLAKPKASEKVEIYQGPQLSDDTGLFVHTVRKEGAAWFGVTSVLEGNENREELASAGPIEGKVAVPQPVLQAVFNANASEGYGKVGKFQIREYVYWEGGANRFHCEPSTPFCFVFHVPRRWVNLGGEDDVGRNAPPWILSMAKVAGYSVSYWDGRGVVMDTGYVPPTRLAPFPPAGTAGMSWPEYSRCFHGSSEPRASASGSSGPSYPVRDVYGYIETINSGSDPRQAVVQPYFENRRLFELDCVLREFPADPNFVWAEGEGSTLNFVLHHPDRFGCAETAQERAWTSPRGAEGKELLIGRREWALKNELGHNVWDWNDPLWLARQFPERAWPFISNCHSDNYDGADNWGAVGFPKLYLELAAEKQGADLWWCDIGDAPSGKFQRVPRNMAYPVFTRATCCQTPLEDWRQEPRGTLNGYLVWHRPTLPFAYAKEFKKNEKAPPAPAGRTIAYADSPWGGTLYWSARSLDLVDTASQFEMTIRIGDEGLMLNGQSVPPCRVAFGAADVTLRRLQQFKVEKGKQYLWQNVKAATGQLLQAGVIAPDERGVLTVPQFFVDKDVLGNKLVLAPADGKPPPAVDKTQKVAVAYFADPKERKAGKAAPVEEIPYEEYAARCLKPELIPVVKSGRVFRVTDFVNAFGSKGGGMYSQWGAGFDDSFFFAEAGRYRIEVETTKALLQHGAWPILGLSIDNTQVGERLLDSEEPITRTWWVDLAQGRHLVRFRLVNNVFNEPVDRNGDQSPKLDRGFTVAGVRFVRLGERPADVQDVYSVALRLRRLVTARGLPVSLKADVLDAWGNPLPAKPEWKASVGRDGISPHEGAAITAGGIFTAAQPGTCTVTASAGGKNDSIQALVTPDSWLEDFDGEWSGGWDAALAQDDRDGRAAGTAAVRSAGVSPARGAADAAEWQVTRHHGFIGALVQRNARAASSHLIVREGGTEWEDISVEADCIAGGEGLPSGPAQALAFRCRDPRNFWRFEKQAAGQEAVFRLVKTVEGNETVLATVKKAIVPLAVDAQTYPSFQHWTAEGRKRAESLRVDRFQVELRGESIVAKLNGQELLTAKDDGPRRGTVGLWCQGGAAFDNIVVRPLR